MDCPARLSLKRPTHTLMHLRQIDLMFKGLWIILANSCLITVMGSKLQADERSHFSVILLPTKEPREIGLYQMYSVHR